MKSVVYCLLLISFWVMSKTTELILLGLGPHQFKNQAGLNHSKPPTSEGTVSLLRFLVVDSHYLLGTGKLIK